MYKRITVLVTAAAIVLLVACDNNTNDDSAVVPSIIENTMNNQPVYITDDSLANASLTSVEQSKNPDKQHVDNSHMQRGHRPGDPIVMTEENTILFETIIERMARVYDGTRERHETGTEVYELIRSDNSIVSVVADPWGEFIGIYYDFYFDIGSDSADVLVETIAQFISTVLDEETTSEQIAIIEAAVMEDESVMSEPGYWMMEPIFIDFGYYYFTMVFMEGYVTIGTGW